MRISGLDNFEQISDFHFKSHTGCGVEKDSMQSKKEVGESVRRLL